jgi:hypothetical protein
MIVLITDDPGLDSHVSSLITAYKKAGLTVLCGLRNFFYSNIKPDFVHILWPEKIYSWYPFEVLSEKEKLNIIESRLRWYKENHIQIVHTINNIKPHHPTNPDFEEKVFKLIIDNADIIVHLCEKSFELLFEIYPMAKVKENIINHLGDYTIDYKQVSKSDAKKHLNIPDDKFVILNFGSQQKYKSEDLIEKVFKQFPVKEKFLLTGGSFRYSQYSLLMMIQKKIRNWMRMRFYHNKRKYCYNRIPPNDLPFYFSSADVVFLAHQKSLNSGIIAIAATYAIPVVYPEIGCFHEQMRNWIGKCYPDSDIRLAVEALKELYLVIKNSDVNFDNTEWLRRNSWDLHVKSILESVTNNKH